MNLIHLGKFVYAAVLVTITVLGAVKQGYLLRKDMLRVLLLIVLVWLVYIVVKRAFSASNNNNSTQNSQKTEEKIVQCARCGLHVPESESLIKDSKVVCNSPDCINLK